MSYSSSNVKVICQSSSHDERVHYWRHLANNTELSQKCVLTYLMVGATSSELFSIVRFRLENYMFRYFDLYSRLHSEKLRPERRSLSGLGECPIGSLASEDDKHFGSRLYRCISLQTQTTVVNS